MSQDHKTKVGLLLHNIAMFFHTHFGGQRITPDLIKNYAEDAAKVANVYSEIEQEVAGITDPAAKVKAIALSFQTHAHELPEDVNVAGIETCILALSKKLTDLPLEQIEAIIKAELVPKR